MIFEWFVGIVGPYLLGISPVFLWIWLTGPVVWTFSVVLAAFTILGKLEPSEVRSMFDFDESMDAKNGRPVIAGMSVKSFPSVGGVNRRMSVVKAMRTIGLSGRMQQAVRSTMVLVSIPVMSLLILVCLVLFLLYAKEENTFLQLFLGTVLGMVNFSIRKGIPALVFEYSGIVSPGMIHMRR
jgi:hypothetical protein